MNIRMSPKWVLLMTAALAIAPALTANEYEGLFEKTLSVSGPVELEVTTGSGNIDVRPGNNSTVHVRGTIKVSRWVSPGAAADKIREIENDPPIEQTGGLIRIGAPKGVRRYISIGDAWRHVSISYELIVPAGTRLKSDTGSGDQGVTGLTGPVKAATGSGNIRLANLSNETRAETGSGDIEITAVAGTVYATTGSGNIRASGVSGSIRANAGSGDVSLQQGAQGLVDMETGSGNVEIHGAGGPLRAHTGSGDITASGSPGGDWKLETGSGNVNLRLSAQAAFTLNAHTGSGNIQSDLPVTVQGKVGRSQLRGTVRGGGSLVDVGTGSGDIRLE